MWRQNFLAIYVCWQFLSSWSCESSIILWTLVGNLLATDSDDYGNSVQWEAVKRIVEVGGVRARARACHNPERIKIWIECGVCDLAVWGFVSHGLLNGKTSQAFADTPPTPQTHTHAQIYTVQERVQEIHSVRGFWTHIQINTTLTGPPSFSIGETKF